MSFYKNVQIYGFKLLLAGKILGRRTSHLSNTPESTLPRWVFNTPGWTHNPCGLCPCSKTQQNCSSAALLLFWVDITLPYFLKIPKLVTIRRKNKNKNNTVGKNWDFLNQDFLSLNIIWVKSVMDF